jgi:Periplasmic binding protein-like domain
MKEIGLEVPPQLLVEGDDTLNAGIKALPVLAALHDRPSAVLCSNDMTAIGIMRGAVELGLNVPRDLSVVGFDGIQMAQFATPPLTTVQMPFVEISNMAFRILLDSVVEVQCDGSSREVCAFNRNWYFEARRHWGPVGAERPLLSQPAPAPDNSSPALAKALFRNPSLPIAERR